MRDWKDNICFILVEPRDPGNIGASARAIKNMGFKNLGIVKAHSIFTSDEKRLACNALDVLENAKTFKSLKAAIGDKSLIAATARRTGRRRGLILPLEKGVGRLIDAARDNNRVAVLFGREDKGLFNEEIDECGFLLTIPAHKDQPSLNLSHAVMVVAYEILRTERVNKKADEKQTALINHEELSYFYERLTEILRFLDYIPHGGRNLEKKIMKNLKHFIGRAGLTGWELKMLLGICSQIEKKLGRKS